MRLRRAALVLGAGLAFLTAAAASAPAGVAGRPAYGWTNAVVGGGGYIPQVIFSPVEPGLAYARSDMGGAYRFDARTGAWTPLQDGFSERSFFGVESLAPDPKDPDVVYMAVGESHRQAAAMLRSADRGAHWRITPVPFAMGGNEDGRGLGERLVVDPSDTRILLFGSRYDGLQRSDDAGLHWRRVASFPAKPLPPGPGWQGARAGVGFVLFAPGGEAPGQPTRTLYAGVADPGDHHLFRSRDGGRTWTAVSGGPDAGLLPMHAALDGSGRLYVTYSDAMGPNGITRGAVWRLDTATGAWRDVTPDRSPNREGGYIGLAVDRQRPGVVMVASADRWGPGDAIWRSTDAGEHWRDLAPISRRDVSSTPFLLWGKPQAKFGWWISALAIDPFAPGHAVYGTGATLYATDRLQDADQGGTLTWRPWVRGIEQTAVLTLHSPAAGAQVLSGFGDISGFSHFDLAASPRTQFVHPVFGNTFVIAAAARAPRIVLREGTPEVTRDPGPPGARLAWSADGGISWTPIAAPIASGDIATEAAESAAVVADGRVFLLTAPKPLYSADHGLTWTPVRGLPYGLRPVPDAMDPRRVYALDIAGQRLFASDDSGRSYRLVARTPPLRPRRDAEPMLSGVELLARPGRVGELWLSSGEGLYRSVDGGVRFARVKGAPDICIRSFSFGAPVTPGAGPAIYALARVDGLLAVWRSSDDGAHWARLNDDAHRWGQRLTAVAGDPKRPGRVYVATDGRGFFSGDPIR